MTSDRCWRWLVHFSNLHHKVYYIDLTSRSAMDNIPFTVKSQSMAKSQIIDSCLTFCLLVFLAEQICDETWVVLLLREEIVLRLCCLGQQLNCYPCYLNEKYYYIYWKEWHRHQAKCLGFLWPFQSKTYILGSMVNVCSTFVVYHHLRKIITWQHMASSFCRYHQYLIRCEISTLSTINPDI